MRQWPEIPGETPIDPSHLKVRGVMTRQQLHDLEFNNVAKAIAKHLAAKPLRRSHMFSVKWSRKIHHDMFCDVWKWAGIYRRSDTNIGVPFYQIELRLTELFENLLCREQHDSDYASQAVELHWMAVTIHPFPNGNGRWSRLISNIWLKVHDLRPVEWPELLYGAESPIRKEYLAAMKAADNHDLRPLTELHKRYMPQA